MNDQPLAKTTVDDAASTSVAVCELVSRVSETPVRKLPPLGRAIDSDCLDELFSSNPSTGRVIFRFAGYDVVVRSSDTVELYSETSVTS